jgi:hypothetical protein
MNGQIVKSAEIMCDTVAIGVNDCEEVGSGGLDELFISDRIICFAAKSAGASFLRRRNSWQFRRSANNSKYFRKKTN